MKKLVLKLKAKTILIISDDSIVNRSESNDKIDLALKYLKRKIFEPGIVEDILLIDNCKLSFSHIDFTTDKEGNQYIEVISDSVTDTLYYYIIEKYRTNSIIHASSIKYKDLIIECYIENYNATNIGDRKNKGQCYKYKITLYMNATIDSINLYNLLCRRHLDYFIDFDFRGASFTQLTLLSGNVEKTEISDDNQVSFIATYNVKFDNYSGSADISVFNDSYESSSIGGYRNIQMVCNMIEENTKESPITEIANISVKLKYNFHRMKINDNEEVISDPYAAMELINKITDKKFAIDEYTAILKNINMDINSYDKILTIDIDCRMSYHNAEKFYSYFRHFPCKLLDYPKVLLKFLDNINFTVECSLHPMSLVMSVDQKVVEKKVEEKKPMEENREYMITIKANEASANDKINHMLKNGIDFIINKSGKNILDIESDMISNYSIEDGSFNILISMPYSFTSMILGDGMKAQPVIIVAYNEDSPMPIFVIDNLICTIDKINRNTKEKHMETITTNTLTVDFKGSNKNYTMKDIEAIKFVSGLRIDKAIIKAIYDQVKTVVFNEPFTKVIWKDGSVTKVSSGKEKYDKEYGVALCILKKMLGNTSNYYDLVKDMIKLADKQKEERAKAKALKEAKKLAAKRKKQKDSEYDTTPSSVPEDVKSNNDSNN